MPSRRDETFADVRNPVFGGLAAGRRREVLGVLLDEDSPVTEQELATYLATAEREPAATDVTAARKRTIRTELVHVHLPTLEEVGLITWNRDDATVATAAHPALEDPRFRLLLDSEVDELDEVLSHLANERRRVLLAILRDERAPTSRTALAGELLRRETDEIDPDSELVEDAAVTLHHVHLPKMTTDDLIEYDSETGRIAYAGHPALEEIFTIIYEPDDRLADSYGGFLDGLKETYTQLNRETSNEANWPHFWRNSTRG